MGCPPQPLPGSYPNGSQKNQPWITRIAPNCGQLNLALGGRQRQAEALILLDKTY